MKRNYAYFLSMLIILTWVVTTGIDFYQRYWPIKIIEHHFDVAPILNPGKKVKRGGYLEFEYKFSKYKDLAAIVSRSFVNDRIVHLTCDVGALEPGLNQKKVHRIYVPQNMFPGRYKLVTHLNYKINDNRQENVSYETEWFEVTE